SARLGSARLGSLLTFRLTVVYCRQPIRSLGASEHHGCEISSR
ncbi:unnamed protein product, partial [Soboliphyme baturini]|uniref:Uncharacterized protein n=1 Tax=Soboliphyme baturini TaxID=241478 RepID=A0A183IE81_9BILA